MSKYLLLSSMALLVDVSAQLPTRTYKLTTDAIDVVIPCVEKDLDTLELAIAGIRAQGQNIRRIIVISKKPFTDKAEWFNEASYPFTKADIALEIFAGDRKKAQQYLKDPKNRLGWMYQQFLKLYAPLVIPDISPNVLALDADTIFLNPVSFVDETGCGLYAPGTKENSSNLIYPPFIEHMNRLIPGLVPVSQKYTGVAHHMLFQKQVILDIFRLIQAYHNTDVWRAICRCIDHSQLYVSPFSEYEIYFNFLFWRTKQAKIRPLFWLNSSYIESLPDYQQKGFHYIACHEYCRIKS